MRRRRTLLAAAAPGWGGAAGTPARSALIAIPGTIPG